MGYEVIATLRRKVQLMSSQSLSELAADAELILHARAVARRMADDLGSLRRLTEAEDAPDTGQLLQMAMAAQAAFALTPFTPASVAGASSRAARVGRPLLRLHRFSLVGLLLLVTDWMRYVIGEIETSRRPLAGDAETALKRRESRGIGLLFKLLNMGVGESLVCFNPSADVHGDNSTRGDGQMATVSVAAMDSELGAVVR